MRKNKGFTPLETSTDLVEAGISVRKIRLMLKKRWDSIFPIHSRKRKFLAGFTLMELMLVIVILGVLIGLVAPRLTGRSKEAKIAAAKADIEANISLALDLFELDNGFYPTTEQGFGALIKEPSSQPTAQNWKGPYLKKKRIPKDPWGNPYIYSCPGTHNPESYDIYSYGPDGKDGGSDDIFNWESDSSDSGE